MMVVSFTARPHDFDPSTVADEGARELYDSVSGGLHRT